MRADNMAAVQKKLLVAIVAAVLGVVSLAAPALAGADINHNETFIADEDERTG